ncbi:polyisoprenoid diphosphate/phosphate phosphohydrolase PLPP6 [Patella vulgata]|uniref:polyisoprenoid diphosphate/phosphate phosphohydrolase PLPP6 n=1 Tax=Patella vulgata TaxID=6465 RepID=UPI00217FF840|nr:polyisoprenoid diphosphate/phosphate phosphohydrolase PLPP6 [Patella vulgata]
MASDTTRLRTKEAGTTEENTSSSEKRSTGKSRNEAIVGEDGLWQYLHKLDVEYTKAWGVCAAKESKLGGLRPLMKLLEISCHGIPWLVANVVFFLCVHREQDVELLVNLFFALIFDIIVVASLKMLFRRPRPPANQMDMFATISVDTYSFPSGHATRAAMLAFFFSNKYLTQWSSIFGVITWSVVVSISRLLLGRHHTSDIIIGYFTGFLEYVIYNTVWIPKENCISWLELYFGHVHL